MKLSLGCAACASCAAAAGVSILLSLIGIALQCAACCPSHCSNAACDSTVTFPCIVKCPVPQSCAHAILYVPSLSGVNQIATVRPGTASCFIRKFGRKKLWITSTERTRTSMGRLAIMWSSLRTTTLVLVAGSFGSSPSGLAGETNLGSNRANRPSGPGYRTYQKNCLPVTSTTWAFDGGAL